MNFISKKWDNYHKNNEQVLCAAQLLMNRQQEVNDSFAVAKKSIFDKSLTDASLYRNDGKFITPYHANLYNKRRNGHITCPVFEISLQSLIQNEYNKDYMAKVRDTSQQKRRSYFEMNLMDVNKAFEEFYDGYLKEAFFHQDKEFSLDERNHKVIYDLVSYFTRQQDCTLNVKKGICLYGDIGTGKSTIMKQLAKFTTDKDLKTQFYFVYMDDIYSDCGSNGLESLDAYKFRSCCFDDIGMRAENNVNSYGTKINSYQELVKRQYRRFVRPKPSLSHYTTNIEYNSKDHTVALMKVFGGRELDRFREMCNFISLEGKSRRIY